MVYHFAMSERAMQAQVNRVAGAVGPWLVAGAVAAIGAAALLVDARVLLALPAALLVYALNRARDVWLLIAALLAFVPFSLLPALLGWGSEMGGGFNTMGMGKDILHMLVLVAIVWRTARRDETFLVDDRATWLFLAYFGWLLVHLISPTALMPGFWSWRIYIEFAVFYLLARAAVRDLRDVRLLLGVWILLALPVLIVAGSQLIAGRLWVFFGEADAWAGARLSLGDETGANYLALFLLPIVLGGAGMAWAAKTRRGQLAWAALALLAMGQAAMTLSRRVYLALAVGFAVLAWFDKRRAWWFGLGAAGVLAALPFVPAGVYDRLASMINVTDYRNVGRFEEWAALLKMVFAGPVQALWGVGPGRVGQVALDFKVPGAISGHNSFLVQLADLGLIGLGFLLALLALHIRLAYRLAREHRGTVVGKTAATLLAIQLGYALTGVFGITYHNYPTNLLAWLAMGLTQALAAHAGQAPRPLPAMRLVRAVWPYRRRLIVVGFLAAVAAYGVCLLLPRSYRAAAHVMVYADRQPAALSLPEAQAPFAAALSDMPGAPRGKEALRVWYALRSKAALHAAFDELGLLPTLFPARWDEANKRWRGEPPTPTAVYEKVWRKQVFVDWFRTTGVLRVTAQWSDPQTAAALADAIVRHGERVAARSFADHAGAKRRALQGELAALDEQLAGVENELAAYRREHELVTPALQADTALTYWGDLWAARIEKDAERAMLLRLASPDHPRARRLRAESAALAAAADRLTTGDVPFLPPLDELAQRQLGDRRLAREQAALDDALTEIAPLAALWQTRAEMGEATLLALDAAQAPERRYFPSRTTTAAAVAALVGYALLLSWLAPVARSRQSG